MACGCPIGNLQGGEQDRRLRRGVVAFMLALGLAVLLLKLEVPTVARAALIVPFFVAANGMYMALFKTCGIMAARGMRVTDDGAEKIANPTERARNWKVGRTVILSAVSTAVAMTLLVVLLP